MNFKHIWIAGLLMLLMAQQGMAITNVSACGTLSVDGTYYTLNQSINSTISCITVGANNITLDLSGYEINITTSSKYGVTVTSFSNITIKNGSIIQSNLSAASTRGINFNNATNSIIKDLNISVYGSLSYGIRFSINSNNNNVSNITAYSDVYQAVGIANSNYSTFDNITASSRTNDAIVFTTSNNNTLNNSNGTSNTVRVGIVLFSNSTNNNIINSIGNSFSQNGILIDQSHYTTLTNCSGKSNSSKGIAISSNSEYNVLTNCSGLSNYSTAIEITHSNYSSINHGNYVSLYYVDYDIGSVRYTTFLNTNFTTRKILFRDTTSEFNYSIDGNLWISTRNTSSSTNHVILNRTLSSLTQSNISFSENWSGTTTGTYTATGLTPNTLYIIYNNSNIKNTPSNTNSSGEILPFSIDFTTTLHTIQINRLNATITPSSDSINVTVTTWNTTGDYYKKWNESSSNASVTTQHTIGDLPANTVIQIKKNGVNWNTYTSNSTGYITFTYADGYSDIQFEAELGTTASSSASCTVVNMALMGLITTLLVVFLILFFASILFTPISDGIIPMFIVIAVVVIIGLGMAIPVISDIVNMTCP